MHEVLVNRLGGLSLPRKSVVRLTDRPDMTLDVYRGRKTTIQQLISQSKFSGTRKFTLRYQWFGVKFDFEISGVDCIFSDEKGWFHLSMCKYL